MSIRPLQAYPILRLTIPLAAGVLFAGTFPEVFPLGGYVAGILALVIGMGVMLWYKTYPWRWLFGVCLFMLFFLAGGLRMHYQWDKVNHPWPDEERVYQGVVQEIPQEKPKTMQCKTTLSDGQNVVFYLAKDSFSRSLTVGDCLWVHARIRPPMNSEATGTFDYASYLLYKGISGTAYVPAGNWRKSEILHHISLKHRALKVRQSIVEGYRSWGIGQEQLPVLSALTIGHKADLSEDVKEAYSVAGIAHVLALSGMHIGFLWLMIGWLLKPLEYGKAGRWIKWGISTVWLWAFAFVAGLEASVVRAVVMCMLMETGRMAGGKTLSMNTLAVAALFMLLYNPFYLYDVSFQLSFMAVLSIVLLYPFFQKKCPSENRWARSAWDVMALSVAAQIGTAPLIMYYFSNFSLYFLLANVGVALLVPCIIYTAFVTMALVLVPWLQAWGIALLDKEVCLLNAWAMWISSWPGASSVSFALTKVDVWGLYLSMGALLWLLSTRKRKAVITLLAIIAGWMGLHCCLLF